MGYELYIKLKEPLYLRGVHINELESELEDSMKDIEKLKLEMSILVGAGFKNLPSPDGVECLSLGDKTFEYVHRLEEMFEEYEDLVKKIFIIRLAIENRDTIEESC
jgi:hypothetical protein